MSKISFSPSQKTLTENINNEEIKEQISAALKKIADIMKMKKNQK